MQTVKRAGKHANGKTRARKHANDKEGLGREQTPQVMKLRNSSVPYLFPANAIPGLITTVSQRGFPAVQHFSTCTLGPTKITVFIDYLFFDRKRD